MEIDYDNWLKVQKDLLNAWNDCRGWKPSGYDELAFCVRFDLAWLQTKGSDCQDRDGKRYELKHVFGEIGPTISNLKGKEDVIAVINSKIVAKKEVLLYIPKGKLKSIMDRTKEGKTAVPHDLFNVKKGSRDGNKKPIFRDFVVDEEDLKTKFGQRTINWQQYTK